MYRTLVGVFGTGGFGREVMPLVEARYGGVVDLAFIEDSPSRKIVNGIPVMSTAEFNEDAHSDRRFLVAIGDPVVRRRITYMLKASGAKPCQLLGGLVIAPGHQFIGEGVIACTYSLIHPNCTIGAHVHLNIYSYVAHDAEVGEFVTLAPKAAINGHVKIGEGAYIGTGVVTKEGVTIGAGAIVGAGAVVVKDVPPGATVVGNPATPLP